ncbi:MAG: hypothetical protein KKB30_04655 [Proteobacteria bacterium]|nr:hypothetical protein [Pseudomonadota bacterium]MBU1715501.1 hypothetical protein [Pseudomonadota bacterium]
MVPCLVSPFLRGFGHSHQKAGQIDFKVAAISRADFRFDIETYINLADIRIAEPVIIHQPFDLEIAINELRHPIS